MPTTTKIDRRAAIQVQQDLLKVVIVPGRFDADARIHHRWRLHGEQRLSKSQHHLHGTHRTRL